VTARALVCGRLNGEPKTRPTKSGGCGRFFKLGVVSGSAVQFWDVATFSDAVRDEFESLAEGASLSAAGELHVETYQRNGEMQLSLKLTADRVMALKPAKHSREAHAAARAPP
jgi:hypothetical protein